MKVENSKELLITDLQSFGCVNYYKSLVRYKKLLFEQCEHYTKRSYSNRYYLATANGMQLLTIPIVHSGNRHTPLKDIQISYVDAWQQQHWRTIIAAYRRSPWFDFYENDLEVMYKEKIKFLLDWNLLSFEFIKKCLQVDWVYEKTKDYQLTYQNEHAIDERHLFSPSKELKSDIRYAQVFEDRKGFLPNMSILDLLFCEGNNAINLLNEP